MFDDQIRRRRLMGKLIYIGDYPIEVLIDFGVD